jgi:factor VIII intron 22 protein
MDPTYDYKGKFKSISVKLKKRLLRKPNINEAIEEYTLLSKKLEEEECYGLAAVCLQNVSKVYHSVNNSISESGALQSAAQQYLNAEISTTIETGIITFNEDLLSAISVYDEAIKLHCDRNERQLAAKLCLEIGDILGTKFERYFEAIPYYQRAVSLFTYIPNNDPLIMHVPIQSILVQLKLAAIHMHTCDYSNALLLYTDVCNAIINLINSNMTSKITKTTSKQQLSDSSSLNKFKDYDTLSIHSTTSTASYTNSMLQGKTRLNGYLAQLLTEADVCKLLLLLYLKPNKLKQEHSNTLEVYSSFQTINYDSHPYIPITCINRDLFILLQSFVMACQSEDFQVLIELQTELYKYLNNLQNFIVNLITENLIYCSPTDKLFI